MRAVRQPGGKHGRRYERESVRVEFLLRLRQRHARKHAQLAQHLTRHDTSRGAQDAMDKDGHVQALQAQGDERSQVSVFESAGVAGQNHRPRAAARRLEVKAALRQRAGRTLQLAHVVHTLFEKRQNRPLLQLRNTFVQ